MSAWWDRYVNPPDGPQTPRQHLTRKIVRRIHWARTEGVGRVIEEDRLDPRPRLRAAVRKRRWRRRHPVAPGSAVPVYVVGLQRSGTNMLMRGLDEAPETEVRNENDRVLFHRFRIRSVDVLRSTVLASRQQFVFVKPICDSQLLDTFLDIDGLAPGAGSGSTATRTPGPGRKSPSSGRPTSWPCVTSPPARARPGGRGSVCPRRVSSSSSRSTSTR